MRHISRMFYIALLCIAFTAVAQEKINITLIVDENGVISFENLTQEKPSEPEPPVEPEPPIEPEPEPTEFLFPEDWQENKAQSTPSKIHVPMGVANLYDVEYLGAFRAYTKAGDSLSSYGGGALAYNAKNHSLFMAGHNKEGSIAEFKIPAILSFETSPKGVVNADVLQPYSNVITNSPHEYITGMVVADDALVINSIEWYDAKNNDKTNIQFRNVDDLSLTPENHGVRELENAGWFAGWLAKVPDSMRHNFNSAYLTGSASNWSITSRLSQGASIAAFDLAQVRANKALINTTPKLYYPFDNPRHHLVDGADKHSYDKKGNFVRDISPVWSPLSKIRYGVFLNNSPYVMFLGSSGAIHHGSGYKIVQDSGKLCPGGCSIKAADNYNYFWIYKVDDIVNSDNPWDAKPISYGKWSHPYDNGTRKLIAATLDQSTNTLYVSIESAAITGKYDRPPMILAYRINNKV